jgi:hypothetical protein
MYGVIEAGRGRWSDPGSFGPILFGLVLLAVLARWERRLTVQGRTPLVDMSLFRIRSFSAGAGLAAVGVFGLFGLLFLLPQYWQAVVGVDTEGAGLRLLPLIGGMAVGAMLADRAAVLLGARTTTAAGLGFLAVAMLGASTTTTGSPGGSSRSSRQRLERAPASASPPRPRPRSWSWTRPQRRWHGPGQAVLKLGPRSAPPFSGTVLAASYQALVPTADLPAAAAQAVRSECLRRARCRPADGIGHADRRGPVRVRVRDGRRNEVGRSGCRGRSPARLGLPATEGRPGGRIQP